MWLLFTGKFMLPLTPITTSCYCRGSSPIITDICNSLSQERAVTLESSNFINPLNPSH